MLDLEQDKIVREITRRNAGKILLQVPDGLRPQAFKLARQVEGKTSSRVIISADPCYGSCDLAVNEASLLDVDMVVHLGHSETIPSKDERCLFIEARSSVDVADVVTKAVRELRNERDIGLASIIQHIGELEKAKRILEEQGKTVIIGKRTADLKYDGQILGCQFETVKSIASKVDAFLILAGGDFHGLGARIATGRRTIVCDPFQNQVRDMEELAKRFFRMRYATIESFRQVRKVGILIGLKTGQFRLIQAEEMRRILESKGYECAMLALREMDPMILENFSDIEGFVNTSCPRVAWDDQERFRKPVLNPEEAMIALGMKRWEDYAKEDNSSKGT